MAESKIINRVNPRASAVVITKSPKHVSTNQSGIERLKNEVVKAIVAKELDVSNFSQHQHHPKPNDKNAIEWIFLIDTLNFCFWTPGNATKWKVCGETGYFALCAAIRAAINRGIDITNANYYSKITIEELSDILRGDDNETKVPLLEERLKCLHEVGTILIEKFDAKFESCLIEADHSARRLLRIVTDEFPCYRDEAEWNGIGISIYKRAQILIGDLWAFFGGQGDGFFEDIEYITMFADYRVPQVLVYFGAMTYDDHLMKLLQEDTILENGSKEEVEIRGTTIFLKN
ncbi:queuosine salvage protein isoform X2 [Contarinia nasturtii]|uniref:queuosine salvage protein isoform X2 n=1 Tax=Contarinia nasturtii TaxID=265458 RepID=UPI0012D39503|nr:queuosine salvage protein isoform X2 [Contarinia nasturtii]